MRDYYMNLKFYVDNDYIYNDYLNNPDKEFTDFEKFCIHHVEDIKDILNEVDSLNKLVYEQKCVKK